MNDFKESSTLSRMQARYWATKQSLCKKLGKKEDDCIVSSDAELDAKLELFQAIEESFLLMMRILENYQDKLCSLAQEENAMGRFLKENGKHDKTRAGKVMMGTGKALSFSAQQKLSLRSPLVRLYHEVETFQYRAIVDTLQTIDKMEKERMAYRGSLMWMKDVSQQLDPDTNKQLEKFRKVQSTVRKTKNRFDKLKLDTLQKVDLLSFSRCNLFSQALAAYQNNLMMISEKTASTMNSVSETTKGYQHYEFTALKELTESSKKLLEETSEINDGQAANGEKTYLSTGDQDVLLFFASEYHDEDENKRNGTNVNLNNSNIQSSNNSNAHSLDKDKGHTYASLINVSEDVYKDIKSLNNSCSDFKVPGSNTNNGSSDLLTGLLKTETQNKTDLDLLNELLDTENTFISAEFSDFQSYQPESGGSSTSLHNANESKSTSQVEPKSAVFLPSHLLDMKKHFTLKSANKTENLSTTASSSVNSNMNSGDKLQKDKQDISNWYNLFADLDPLANPDLIGKKHIDDLDC